MFTLILLMVACQGSSVSSIETSSLPVLPTETIPATKALIFPGNKVDFDVIATGDDFFAGVDQIGNKPEAIMIASPNQKDPFRTRLNSNNKTWIAIETTDLSEYLLIVVFQGMKSEGGYRVDVKKVIEQKEKLIVVADFVEPGKGIIIQMTATCPYQVIRIPLRRLNNSPLEVELHFQVLLSTPQP